MSRNDELWERGLRILYFSLPMNEKEAVEVLKKYLQISEEEASNIYNYWLRT